MQKNQTPLGGGAVHGKRGITRQNLTASPAASQPLICRQAAHLCPCPPPDESGYLEALSAADYTVQLEQAQASFLAGQKKEQAAPKEPPKPRPLQVDVSAFSGSHYADTFPPAFDWLLKGSLRRKTLGAIIGAPGSGKSTAAVQMAVAVAAGLPWLGTWNPDKAECAIYISAEDDELILHRRVHHVLKGLPEEVQAEAAGNLFAVPVTGDVALCRGGGGDAVVTESLNDLRAILEAYRPALLVLDTLARFLCVPENDNPAMTAACTHLEEMSRDYGCSIILLHHTAKASGSLASDPAALDAALEQTASRGASALTGCVRWQMNLAPLSAKLAAKIIGEDATGRPDGSFVAIRVSKKNSGAPEPRYFLARAEQGLLRRVEPVAQEQVAQSVEEDAAALVVEVQRRAKEGLEPLAASRGGRDAFGWGHERNNRAILAALDSREIVRARKERGNGEILQVKACPEACPAPLVPACPIGVGQGILFND